MGAKRLDLWIPVPHDDPYQQIRNLQVRALYPHTTATAARRNTILHLGVDSPRVPEFNLTLTFDATRTEHIQSRLKGGQRLTREEDADDLALHLQPERLVPLDKQIRTWAADVVREAKAGTDLEMARAIYNHVIATVKYDKSGTGWGRGDIYYACDARRGNCTDFHAIFIGYARAVGVPARFAIGFPLPAGRDRGAIAGYHCWAEFYARGIGWVPVDASEAAKDPSKREYFFGAHDEHRVEFSKGRDVVLVPEARGGPLNFFIYPYAEIDGKPFDTTYEATFRGL